MAGQRRFNAHHWLNEKYPGKKFPQSAPEQKTDEIKCIVKPINILPNEKIRDAFVRVGKKKYYINTPYAKKDIAKNLGARWDPKTKKWYYKTEDVDNKYYKLSNENMSKLIELFT